MSKSLPPEEKEMLIRSHHCKKPGCNNNRVVDNYSLHLSYYCSKNCFQLHLEENRKGAAERVKKFLEKKK